VAERFGFHVRNDDYDTGLRTLLADDQWRRKGQAAREYVLTHYELQRSTDRHLDLYRGLLAAG
jgi:hypothetical protein